MALGTDVIFLLDASTGVTEDILDREKVFIKRLAANFDISPSGPRGAAVLYAENTYIIASFIERDFESQIDRASLLNRAGRIDRALEQAAQIFRTSRRAGRKVVVLLTAGSQAVGGKPLDEAVQPLDELGAQVFVVAFKDRQNYRELSRIVQAPQDFFSVTSLTNLSFKTRQIGNHIRNKPGTKLSIEYFFLSRNSSMYQNLLSHI